MDKKTYKVVMYKILFCPSCQGAMKLLEARGVERESIQEVYIDREPSKYKEMVARTQRRTVPQIFIGDTYIGGYDDLLALDRENRLLPLLKTG